MITYVNLILVSSGPRLSRQPGGSLDYGSQLVLPALHALHLIPYIPVVEDLPKIDIQLQRLYYIQHNTIYMIKLVFILSSRGHPLLAENLLSAGASRQCAHFSASVICLIFLQQVDKMSLDQKYKKVSCIREQYVSLIYRDRIC